jgi:flagellar assembly protein FliH
MESASDFSFEALEPLVAPPAASPAVALDLPPAPLTAHEELALARAEAEQLRAAARDEGFREGYADGRAQGLAEAGSASLALAEMGAALHAQSAEAATRLEERSVQLALALAEKIVAGALAVRPELVVEAVRHALRGIVERERITVLVHPDDLAVVSASMSGVQAEMGGIEHWEVQAERRVGRGGAVVRHAHGDVDAEVESKLRRAREVVEAALTESE